MSPSASRVAQVKESIGKTELPLTQESELPAFTDAQSNVIEIYKREVLDNLSEMLPPVDGEAVEATSFSLLAGDFQDFPANTPVLTVSSNYSTLNYLFTFKARRGRRVCITVVSLLRASLSGWFYSKVKFASRS